MPLSPRDVKSPQHEVERNLIQPGDSRQSRGGLLIYVAAPAHSPSRPPLAYDAVGGREGEWAGAAAD
jgi:hypothetical protein